VARPPSGRGRRWLLTAVWLASCASPGGAVGGALEARHAGLGARAIAERRVAAVPAGATVSSAPRTPDAGDAPPGHDAAGSWEKPASLRLRSHAVAAGANTPSRSTMLALQSFRDLVSQPSPPGQRPSSARSGTACMCVCGDRVVWNRIVFEGNVEAQKEHECEHEVCPQVIIPGLKVNAECAFVKDLSELQAGTMCQCQCGDKLAWRNRPFYGNVTEEQERYCVDDLCPRINPLPGVRFEAHCVFDPYLFSSPRTYPAGPPQLQPPPPHAAPVHSAAPRTRPFLALVVALTGALLRQTAAQR